MFKAAGPAEIIRSHQKDDYYLGYLRNLTAQLVHNTVGPRTWIQWRKEVEVLADLGYFMLTTFSGNQTVGEEYVNVIQVDRTGRNVPSLFRRGLMVLLHVLTPYCLRRALDWLERKLRAQSFQEVPLETREFLLTSIPVLRTSILYCHRLHMAVFYLRGVFYHIAKRTAGVQYIQYDFGAPRDDNSVGHTFKVLGLITLAQLLGSGLIGGYRFVKDKSKQLGIGASDEDSTSETGFVSADRKCALCLEGRKHSSVTPCGHLFCWTCIHDWCQTKTECPLCREKFEPHRIVCLQNFDPP